MDREASGMLSGASTVRFTDGNPTKLLYEDAGDDRATRVHDRDVEAYLLRPPPRAPPLPPTVRYWEREVARPLRHHANDVEPRTDAEYLERVLAGDAPRRAPRTKPRSTYARRSFAKSRDPRGVVEVPATLVDEREPLTAEHARRQFASDKSTRGFVAEPTHEQTGAPAPGSVRVRKRAVSPPEVSRSGA